MANYNKVILVGNLTRDPQLNFLPSQTPVAEFGLAVNRKWKAQDGQQKEDVCFVDCRCYGKQAEVLKQYMAKGRQLLVEGRLHLDSWEKDGVKRSKHVVVVESFQFLGQPGGGQGGAYNGAQQAARPQARPAQAPAAMPDEMPAEPPPPDFDTGSGENIPF